MVDKYDDAGDKVLSPAYFAHAVLRTANWAAMAEFYKKFLGGHATWEKEGLSFITYDEEHHRVAILQLPDTGPKVPSSSGLEHLAFAYKTIEDLALAYRQRLARGIHPFWCVNHGPTTSIYYKDPDGNKIETQVDNFPTVIESGKFMVTPEFRENPVGTDFDPEELVARLRSGEDWTSILKRPEIGPRSTGRR